MKTRTGAALAALFLIAGSGMAAPTAAADEAPAADREPANGEAEWQRKVEARLDQDARAIATDAMDAASRLELPARLDEHPADYRMLALAGKP